MRRLRVLGSVLGCLVVGSACATTTGGSGGRSFSSTPQVTQMSGELATIWRDSIYAQAIADVEGPRASISAQVSNTVGSRRLRGVFRLDDDAYVVVGHIDANGVLRVVFPLDPRTDDGFVQGGKSYQTQEFLAGFTDEYRMRMQSSVFRSAAMPRFDSYDGGLGHLFIIASWRPMQFDRFQTEGAWDAFELSDYDTFYDPKPAIHELASLLAGENREAYTVKLARYSTTRGLYGADGLGYSAFSGFAYCAGTRPLGFAFNPLYVNGDMFDLLFSEASLGRTFMRRGGVYYYNRAMGCYTPSSFGGSVNNVYRIANSPFANPGTEGQNTPKRPFDPNGHRTPFTPRIVNTHAAAPTGRVSDVNDAGSLPTSPQYRQRGLITTDEPVGTGRRQPRVATNGFERPMRPSIQDMVNRRPVTTAAGSRPSYGDRSRYQATAPASDSYSSSGRRSSSSNDVGSRGSTGLSSMVPQSYSTPASASAPPASPPPSSQASPPAGSSSSSGGRPGTP